MKVPELIHSAIDGIILSQLLEYVTVTKVEYVTVIFIIMFCVVKM